MSAPDLSRVTEVSFVMANGLRHRRIVYGEGEETIVLCHGFLDFAWSFALVAQRLADAGFRVVLHDFRGYGESEWIGAGGYYHFPDYVYDLDRLVADLSGPLHLVGHSMGGTIVSMLAGLRPKRFASVTLVEGLGPPVMGTSDAPTRFERWIDNVERARARTQRPLATLDEVLERLREAHGPLEDGFGRFLAERSTRATDEGFVWRFDPLHRTSSPMPFQLPFFLEFLARIEASVLYVAGEKGFRIPDEAMRLATLKSQTTVEIPAVGHMIHWFAPEALANAVIDHVRCNSGFARSPSFQGDAV